MTPLQTSKITALSFGLALLGAVGIVLAPMSARSAPWLWVVVGGIGYAIATIFPIEVESRGERHGIAVVEIGLALSVTRLDRPQFAVAWLVAAIVIAFDYRHRTLPKALFAVCSHLAVWGTAAMIFGLIGGASTAGPRTWLGLLGAATACSITTHSAIGRVVSIVNERREALLPMLRVAVGSATINALLAALVVDLLAADWRSVWMIAALAVGLWFGYRSYLRLMQRYGSLDLLHTFSHGLAGITDSDQIAVTTLTMAKELLRGEVAELVFRLPDGVLVKCVTADGTLAVRGFRSGTLPPEHTLLAFDSGVVVRAGDTFLAHRELAERLGWRDLASAPIGAEGFEGVLVVANRLAESSTFDDEDLRVLETFAKNTGVALKVGELVEELRREAAEKEFESLHDSLTGLPNRERIEQVIATLLPAARLDSLVAVLVMDLNDFKDVNDSLGHSTGDSLLEEIGRRLASAVDNRSATVARLGSDEFAVVVPGLPTAHAVLDYADMLRGAVEEPYLVDQLSVAVRFSVGVAIAPHHGTEPRALLQRADIAMYAAKHSVNGVTVYRAELDKASIRRLSLAGELQPALDNSEFQLFYQPQVDLISGRVAAVEALARWPHAVHKSVPPDEFIPLVEQSGLIGPFTRWAIGTALADVALWREEFSGLRVSVNMSARNLLDQDFPHTVRSLLEEHGLDGRALTLELTESTVMDEPERSMRVLDALHAMGIRIAIDDFGTGYSSLSYLKRLPVAEVKIDKSFVMNMVGNCDDTAIVRSTIDLARNLGMDTVAEGVETMAAMEQLRGLGCWAAQGYHLSRPIPAVDVAAKIRSLDERYSTTLPERPVLARHARRSA